MSQCVDLMVKKWARKDSNLQPSGYEPPAPPLSYGPVKAINLTTATLSFLRVTAFFTYFCIFAQVSTNEMVRLKTRLPGTLSLLSGVK